MIYVAMVVAMAAWGVMVGRRAITWWWSIRHAAAHGDIVSETRAPFHLKNRISGEKQAELPREGAQEPRNNFDLTLVEHLVPLALTVANKN